MGCYGIGVSRIIAAAIEQNYDTNGIIWPKSISPFDVVIIEIDGDKNEEVRKYSESIYEMLINRDIDVILDDRNAKLGNKLHDWELIGVPQFIIVGRSEAQNNEVTYKKRGAVEKDTLKNDEITINGDGTQKSEYIYVDDVVESFERALNKKENMHSD